MNLCQLLRRTVCKLRKTAAALRKYLFRKTDC